MKCNKTEKWLLSSFDKKLTKEERNKLEQHLKTCSSCQKRQKEYQFILNTLRNEPLPSLKPFFWQRLKPKLRRKNIYETWTLWKKWGLRAISFSFLLMALFALTLFLFSPQEKQQLSQSEALLLRNQLPFQETRSLLEEEGWEEKNIRLIFTSLEEQNENGIRRYFP